MVTASTNRIEDLMLARKILAAYSSDVAAIEPLARFNNPVFRCALPDGSRILKISKSLDGAATRKELLLIEHLSRHGIPVPDVERADAAGELVGRPFILMRSSGDQTVADLLGPGETARNLLVEMGVILAKIHQTPTTELTSLATDRISAKGVETYLETLAMAADALAAQGLLGVADTLEISPKCGLFLIRRRSRLFCLARSLLSRRSTAKRSSSDLSGSSLLATRYLYRNTCASGL